MRAWRALYEECRTGHRARQGLVPAATMGAQGITLLGKDPEQGRSWTPLKERHPIKNVPRCPGDARAAGKNVSGWFSHGRETVRPGTKRFLLSQSPALSLLKGYPSKAG